MFKNILELLKTPFKKRVETPESIKKDIQIKSLICLVLSAASVILTILNIVNHYWDMMYATIALFVSFMVSFILFKVFKIRRFTEVLISLTIISIFSYFAIAGQNHGFAILWIALVPAIGMLLLSFKAGMVTSLYFLVFLIVIFYTPLNGWLCEHIQIMQEDETGVCSLVNSFRDNYTNTFRIRFPILYFCGFFISLLLTAQKEHYLVQSEKNAVIDVLTNLKNRRFFKNYLEHNLNGNIDKNFTVVSLDLNGLKVFNDRYGHQVGDNYILFAAKLLVEIFGKYTDYIFRTGGDEFFVFFSDTNDEISSLLEKLEEREREILIAEDMHLSMSYGYVKGIEYMGKTAQELISIAESAMYEYKENFYKDRDNRKIYDARSGK